MDKRLLRTVIADQMELKWNDSFLRREIPDYMINGNEIVVISGIRRCGKSTLLHQIRDSSDENAFYMNFDDDRLIQFKVEDFQMLLELFIELFTPQKTLYFDEIQNVEGWETFVRRVHDYGYKIFVTGSNATMLSRELGTRLSGRFVLHELFPFSFKEYLAFKGVELQETNTLSTEIRAQLQKHFSDFFIFGGFPVYIRHHNPEYLKMLYDSILFRDVLVRNNLTNEKEMQELVYFLVSNIAKPSSYNALSKVIGISNPTTIKNYTSFLQNAYMLFATNKYDVSLKKQIQNPKKFYFIDNALVKTLGFYFSDDTGRLLENLVFIELLRRKHDVFYHSNQKECDFVIRSGNSIKLAIQVTHSISEKSTRQREINGLMEAMEQYNLASGMIITTDEEESITIDERQISVIPAWKWLLNQ